MLSGHAVPSSFELDSKDFSSPPFAVITGAAYDQATISTMMAAAAAQDGSRPVPWLCADTTKPAPPMGPEYGKAMVQRAKECLSRLRNVDGIKESKVVWY